MPKTLRLTPEVLEAAYEFLRITSPFKGWSLPHADDLEFRVTRHADRWGHFDDGESEARALGKSKPKASPRPYTCIAVSEIHVTNSLILLETMAHEMCHLHQHLIGSKAWPHHGPQFRALARRVCQVHGFKLETF